MNAFPICRGNAPPPPAGGGGVGAGLGSDDIRFAMTKIYEVGAILLAANSTK
jgi:hypothetical protein